MFFVYLLISSDNYSYVGATVDLDRRLRQHNKEIKGGAHATSSRVKKGMIWKRMCHVCNFPTWSAALQFEWRWKHISRKLNNKIKPIDRRMQALYKLLSLERSTSKAVPYCEWDKLPDIIFEDDDCEKYYKNINSSDI